MIETQNICIFVPKINLSMEEIKVYMNKTIITALLLILTLGAKGEQKTDCQINAEVSETVELMGILSRTAGFQEYCHDLAGEYTKDTEAWFAPHKTHPTIAYYQDLRANCGISYEKVTNMAIHLEINKGKVKFVGDKAELTNGWQNADIDEFVKRLNQFYTDTRFHEFFEQHQAFYAEALRMYQVNVMPTFHPEWYTRFYYGTEPTEQFRVILSFIHGKNNNGAWRQLPGKPREVYAFCGYWIDPAKGRPRYEPQLLFHEICHAFVNPLLDDTANLAMIEDAGRKLFQFSQVAMTRQAYNNWQTVINESLVRAAVIINLLDNGFNQKQVGAILTSETLYNEFRWMPELVTALRHYAANRDKYKTFNDYYPEISKCLTDYINAETERMMKAIR